MQYNKVETSDNRVNFLDPPNFYQFLTCEFIPGLVSTKFSAFDKRNGTEDFITYRTYNVEMMYYA